MKKKINYLLNLTCVVYKVYKVFIGKMKVINGSDQTMVDCPVATNHGNNIKTETQNKLDEIQQILNTHQVLQKER